MPVAVKVGVCPLTGLLLASLRVMVTVEVSLPSATTGPEPVILELTATGVPAVKVTEPPVLITGVAMDKVFTSAVVESSVQVEIPDVFEIEHVP